MAASVPRYLDVADTLQREISELAPNSLLATEEQMARRFGVSRVTVRSALDLLEKRGLVSRLRGRGTTVSPSKITRRFVPLFSFERDLTEQGITFETQVLSFNAKVAPPNYIAERLHLSEKTKVGSLALVRVVDDRIVCHDQRYYPVEIASRMDPGRIEIEDSSRVLEDLAGSAIVDVDWESEIVSAPGPVASALGIVPRTLVVANTYTWHVESGVPLEAGVISYRIDRCKFRYQATFGRAPRAT